MRPLDGRPVVVAKDDDLRQLLRLFAGREDRLAEAVWALVEEPQPVPFEGQDMLRLDALVPAPSWPQNRRPRGPPVRVRSWLDRRGRSMKYISPAWKTQLDAFESLPEFRHGELFYDVRNVTV